MRSRTTLIVPAALLAALATLAGCGDSGANRKPTVTVKRTESAPAGATNGTTEPELPPKPNGEAPAASPGGFGSFSGRVVLTGTAPPKKLLYKKGDTSAKDAAVCAAMDLPDQSLLVSDDGGVANVFIYLAKAPKGSKAVAVPTEAKEFDQHYCQFKPHALALRAGQTLKILNDDELLHNTHLFPQKGPNQAANSNFALQPKDRAGVEYVYKTAETAPVEVKCDIHAFMKAWQLPLDHPYVAVTDEDGKFEIKDVPAGSHEFVIWQEKGGRLDGKYKVTIEADKTTEKEISFPASSFTAFQGPPPKVLRLSAR